MNSAAIHTRNDLSEIKEAVDRLASQDDSSNPFLWNHGPAHQNDFILMIRQFTAMRGGTFRQPSPLSRVELDQLVSQNFEEDLWNSFGLKGPLVPDELLKDCQKRLHQAAKHPGSLSDADHTDLTKVLKILDVMHRKRKASSSFNNHVYPKADWASLTAIPPHQFRKNISPGLRHRFWALVIGNDKYPGAELKGCINDAELVQDYLKEYLGVPSNQVRVLKNVTRQQMIDGLYDLRDNTNIKNGDNILFHFSGHGTTYDPSKHFESFVAKAGSIEGICPIDRGSAVPDISDRELNAILNELHDEKRKKLKISVFLDCCRGGGAARSTVRTSTHRGPNDHGFIRYVDPLLRMNEQTSGLEAMFNAADANPRRGSDTPLTSCEFWLPNVEKFVQLACCHDFQIAKEGSFELVSNPKSKPSGVPSQVHERLLGLDFPKDNPERGKLNANTAGRPKPKPTSSGDMVTEKQYGCFTWALVHVLRSNVGQTGTYEHVIQSIGRLSDIQDPVVVGRKNSRLWFEDGK